MQIQILSVEVKTVPTPKGSYQQADVAFKNLTFQGKIEGRKLMSFGAGAKTFQLLSTAQQGSVWNITVVKNDKGFNDWVAAERGVEGVSTVADTTGAPTPSGQASKAASAAVRSSYESPEERAARQVLIVRQSSLSTAADVLTTGAKSPPKSEEVIALAKEFEHYVFGTKPDLSGFDTMMDDSAEVM